ncbi:MAG: hypothetical protein ABIB61_03880 [Candidatus Shapirobacteria bacterium]
MKGAREKGLRVKKMDLNKKIPKGEMATFTFALHHLDDKENVLNEVVRNFKYLFLREPVKDLYHALFDAGKTLPKKDWLVLFDRVLKDYQLYQHKSSLIVFWSS